MTFELTDELADSIISALENQEKRFVVDSKSGLLAEKTQDFVCDEENFYELPSWDSKDGFDLMEGFVNELHSPMARNDLLNVLRSGRGVFRGFKDVLKSYPEVEKRWHFFKNRQLINYINRFNDGSVSDSSCDLSFRERIRSGNRLLGCRWTNG